MHNGFDTELSGYKSTKYSVPETISPEGFYRGIIPCPDCPDRQDTGEYYAHSSNEVRPGVSKEKEQPP